MAVSGERLVHRENGEGGYGKGGGGGESERSSLPLSPSSLPSFFFFFREFFSRALLSERLEQAIPSRSAGYLNRTAIIVLIVSSPGHSFLV